NETFYDANGNVIATRDARGTITRTYYDALNRPFLTAQNVLESNIYSDSLPVCYTSGVADSFICTWTFYDASGNATASRVQLGTVTRTYSDALSRPSLVVHNLDTASHSIEDPDPSACNRDPLGAGHDYNLCSETIYDETTGQAIATIDPLG